MGLIYKATSKTSGKSYIGLTSRSLEHRRQVHYFHSQAKSKKTKLFPFQMAIRKYGMDDFEWEVLFETDSPEELKQMETYYIGKFNTFEDGYNLTLGGEGFQGGKKAKGEEVGTSITTEEQAKEIIKHIIETDLSLHQIAEKLSVSYSVVNSISGGATWKHLYDTAPYKLRKCNVKQGARNGNSKLKESDVAKIKGLLSEGKSRTEIAKVFNVGYSTVERIDKGLNWSHVKAVN